MKKDKTKLTAKQIRAISSMISESSMEGAAKKAGTSRATLYRWLELPAFRVEFERGQRIVFSGALARLQGAARLAVDRMIEALDSKSPAERRLAASQILDFCFKAQEIGEFSERLSELEERIFVGKRPNSLL